MFLKYKPTGDLVEVITLDTLFDPCTIEIVARSHVGEEMQEPENYRKSELVFPSEEPLPRCWVDAHYRENIPPIPKPTKELLTMS